MGMARRTLFTKVGRTMPKGAINSVNRTIRDCMEPCNCSMLQSCMNRNVNVRVRRSPRVPGCKAPKRKPQLRRKVIVYVRPVIAVNETSVVALHSN